MIFLNIVLRIYHLHYYREPFNIQAPKININNGHHLLGALFRKVWPKYMFRYQRWYAK